MINDLLNSISKELNIPKTAGNEWVCQIVYSVAGQMALASLLDHTEDSDTISIQHFKDRMKQIFDAYRSLFPQVQYLLSGCTCDSACHKCLKHYRNQYIHGSLDRKAALDLLEWGSNGERTPAIPYQKQQYMLRSLAQILQLSGVTIYLNQAPIEAEGRYSKKKVVVYPSMWAKPSASNTIFVSDSYLKYAKPYAVKTIVDSL